MNNFNETDMDFFLENIYNNTFLNNKGGMCSCDMFTLYISLKNLKPKVVIESGVWNGLSTKLIRKVLGDDVIIICLDPREIPSNGFIDKNKNTIYYTGKKFIDFKDLNLNNYNKDEILCFFDDHQNAIVRLLQCKSKKIKHIFYNDNYPPNCGSHFTIQHLKYNDNRFNLFNNNQKKLILNLIQEEYIFPNIYPGKIKTGEGLFNSTSYFKNTNNNINNKKYNIFKLEREKYRWNTYIKLN